MNRTRRLYIWAVCLWASAAAPFALASVRPGLFERWFPVWSRNAGMVLSYATGFVPFSAGELLIAALAVTAAVYWARAVIRAVRGGGRGISRAAAVTLVWTGAAAALFIWLWGLNYSLPGPAARMGYTRDPYSKETLAAAAFILGGELNETSLAVPRGDDLRMLPPTFGEARDGVAQAYRSLAEAYGFFTPHGAKVKRITFWPLQSYTGVSGIYIPWTAESCVNPDTPWPSIAFTMAHETAHRQGAAAEDEANLIGILACRRSDEPSVRYAGAFVAFIHVSNALSAADPFLAWAVWDGLEEGVLADMGRVREHYEYYEEAFGGVFSEAGEAVNDAYLKTMGQPEGVSSYGMVTDLLVSDLKARGMIK
ncbi:MAG: DUF3810 domain-containing protein [Oscillospiraceae bacterium]|nr:DUF3810 domain-containing protein [Oscillospiraceae bacterium]